MPGFEDIVETFELLGEWEEKYAYLIDLGKQLEPMDEALKTDGSLVRGCTSRVWMVATQKAGKYHFIADSDAHIVRGLIAVLLAAYNDKTPAQMRGIDIEGEFAKLGLDSHLSPNRRNGFFAMVERVRGLAA